ncbi:MAG TPA: NepR family anti-sigma factor [Sphingomicrobium sp.]|nr:NepR family anti-sigma factor [Sphingomicrobium sp.]
MSDSKARESSSADGKSRKRAPKASKAKRTQRGSDIGRALRSVYDETLREHVPDDFLDLLGKLS